MEQLKAIKEMESLKEVMKEAGFAEVIAKQTKQLED